MNASEYLKAEHACMAIAECLSSPGRSNLGEVPNPEFRLWCMAMLGSIIAALP
jgi:hypothetical protein